MLHSIVIPLYNKAPFIHRTIRSLAKQTYPASELIIIDDCSTDGSFEDVKKILGEYSEAFKKTKIKLIKLKENGGPSHARNIGLKEASGDWISLLDADDEYVPEFLARVKSIISIHQPDLIILGIICLPSGRQRPDVQTIESLLESKEEDLYFITNPLALVTWKDFPLGPGSNVLCRRTILQDLSYDEGSDFFEGVDFWYRVIRRAYENSSFRSFLLMGDYLKVDEFESGLTRRRLLDVDALKFPGILKRLAYSTDKYDQALWKMIAGRWFYNVLMRLETTKAKLLFLWRFRCFILRYYTR